MDKSILLHCISPDELKQIIREILKEEFIDFKKNFFHKDSDILLTREEACKLLKIKKTSLWKWTKNGKLKSYGLGNRCYYKKEELLNSIISLA